MSKPLSKEAFRAQFSKQVTLSDEAAKLLTFTEKFHGYEIYQCLNRLLLKDEKGQFWIT